MLRGGIGGRLVSNSSRQISRDSGLTCLSQAQNFPKARDRLEDLRKGGAKMEKSRVSRSAVNKQTEGECVVM